MANVIVISTDKLTREINNSSNGVIHAGNLRVDVIPIDLENSVELQGTHLRGQRADLLLLPQHLKKAYLEYPDLYGRFMGIVSGEPSKIQYYADND